VFHEGELRDGLERVAERLLMKHVEMSSSHLAAIAAAGIDSANWLTMKEPRDVRLNVELLIRRLVETKTLLHEAFRVVDRPKSSTTEKHMALSPQRPSWASLREEDPFRSAVGMDVARVFSSSLGTFTLTAPEFDTASVLTEEIKYVLKSFLECIRLQTFGTFGFQQMQVDCTFLRRQCKKLVDDGSYMNAVLDQIATSTRERCVEAIPLEESVVETIVSEKMQST
jgi:vacuolar protein sorting-associated protein 51